MEYPVRKPNRLPEYDYSQNGAYFITICTQGRKEILSKIVGNDDEITNIANGCMQNAVGEPIRLPFLPQENPILLPYGQIVKESVLNISICYPQVQVDKYVIMPNHVHLIITIEEYQRCGKMISSPTVSTVIGQMKRYASKQAGISLWQRSFHDHVIRGERDYKKIWAYIDENPYHWREDCFYPAR